MRTLIIPDIHLDVDWADRMLKLHQPQRVIFLGDYFDPSPRARALGQLVAYAGESEDMLRWLADVLTKFGDAAIPLIGNHDAPYLFPEFADLFWLNNTSDDTFEEIEELPNEIALLRAAAKWFYFDGASSYLFSHAGISAKVFAKADGSVTTTNIDRFIEAGMEYAEAGKEHPAFAAGRCRGGVQSAGGLIWLDFNAEFEPVPGFKQVMGHTSQLAGVGSKDGNYAIDGIQTTVALLVDGKLKVITDKDGE